MLRTSSLFVLILALLSGCGDSSAPSGFGDAITSQLDALMVKYQSQTRAPGVVLGVWSGSKEYLRAIGQDELATGKAMSATPLFRIGSLTKTFTGTVILQLVDEKKLGLDDTLETVLPATGVPNADKITVRNLLMMTAGVASYNDKIDPKKAYTPQQLLDIIKTLTPSFAPGASWEYSNSNTTLLGLMIEKRDESTLGASIKRRIFDPLKLTGSSFPSDGTMPGEYIHGYMRDPDAPEGALLECSTLDPSWGWAAGAIVSTIADVRTYITALGQGKLLSQDMQRKRMSEWWDTPDATAPSAKYGLGWATIGGFYGHNGSVPGYINMAMFDPTEQTAIVLMLNIQPATDVTRSMMIEVIRTVFPYRTF
jgi:D-alanyl-D-alanine carboxypeptidase